MEYKTYRRTTHSWYAVALGNPPIFYVQSCESEILDELIGPIYKISSNPDFRKYHVISEYMLRKHFTPVIYNNIFMRVK